MGIKAKRITPRKEVLLEKIEGLSEKDIQEVINFIEFLRVREDQIFKWLFSLISKYKESLWKPFLEKGFPHLPKNFNCY